MRLLNFNEEEIIYLQKENRTVTLLYRSCCNGFEKAAFMAK